MANISTDTQAIETFLTRGVENVYPKKEKLAEILASGKRLTVYYGIDPTGPSIHLGHLIPLRKFAELQKMGHKIILLIGDFTAMIGDPTDKLATRKQLTRKEVLANCKEYKKQLKNVINFTGANAAEIRFNSKWLAKMSFSDVVELAAHFTVQQMSERDTFAKRLRWDWVCPNCHNVSKSPIQFPSLEAFQNATLINNQNQCIICKKLGLLSKENIVPSTESSPVYLHEFLYPLMQGYDSVAMEVDLEIGGNDQTFNMLAGRTLLREMKGKEKFVLTTKLLVDSTGKKMGKSEGNMIALTDSPEDIYGKVMSWSDDMILSGFELCTNVLLDEAYKKGIIEQPMAFKRKLAHAIIVELFGGKENHKALDAAEQAADHFSRLHQRGELPTIIDEFEVDGSMPLMDVLVKVGFVKSKSDARRQIEQKAVKIDGEVVTDISAKVSAPATIQKGSRFFVKLV